MVELMGLNFDVFPGFQQIPCDVKSNQKSRMKKNADF